MKSSVFLFFYLLFFSLILGCQQNTIEFPENPEIKVLAAPIQINPDSTKIFLRDFFPGKPEIDSFAHSQFLSLNFDEKKYNLNLQVKSESLPLLSVLKVWVKNQAYDLLLKKSPKIKYKFTYTSPEEYEKIQIKGEFNAWNSESTPLAKNGNQWETTFFIEPGSYQYLLVLDGKELLDPTNQDSITNNMGGYNSLLSVGKHENLKPPVLKTLSFTEKSIKIEAENNPKEIFVFFQNYLLPVSHITKEENNIEIKIPGFAKNKERSYIRVWAYNTDGISNDLLVPLHFGKVINNPENLKRDDYEAAIIYNVFIDRFFDGDHSNTKKVDDPQIHPRANYYGGDISGVISKVEDGYFSTLSVNTIWISPIVLNPDEAYGLYPEPKTTFSGYHGYWPVSFTKIDPRYGTEEVLKKLVEKVHEKEMNILLDFVANHVHENHPIYKEHPEWATTLYLPDGTLNTEKWDTYRLTTWFDVFLPTLDLSKPEVYQMLSDSALFWVEHYDLDGFRHDATKHIPEVFWQTLTWKLKKNVAWPKNKKIFQIGETYGTPELISSYVNTGQLDAQFDFNVYDAIITALAGDAGFENLAVQLEKSAKFYGSHHLMGNISGNQDRARFISYASGDLSFGEDSKKAGWTRSINFRNEVSFKKSALLFTLIASIPGIPVVYYGDEIGMPGGNDPDNRRMMRFDNLSAQEKKLKESVASLFEFRLSHMPLIFGDMEILSAEKDLIAIQRCYFDEFVITLINNSSEPTDFIIDLNPRFPTSYIKTFENNLFKLSGKRLIIKIAPYSYDIITNKKNN